MSLPSDDVPLDPRKRFYSQMQRRANADKSSAEAASFTPLARAASPVPEMDPFVELSLSTMINGFQPNEMDGTQTNLEHSDENDDPFKMFLSNEELAMITQGKPNTCLEIVLNNGDILYALVDSESDINNSSTRFIQVPKELATPSRSVSLNLLDQNSDMGGYSSYPTPFNNAFRSYASPNDSFVYGADLGALPDEQYATDHERMDIVGHGVLMNEPNDVMDGRSDIMDEQSVLLGESGDIMDSRSVLIDERSDMDGRSVLMDERSSVMDERSVLMGGPSDIMDGRSVLIDERSDLDGRSLLMDGRSDMMDQRSVLMGEPSDIMDGRSVLIDERSDLEGRSILLSERGGIGEYSPRAELSVYGNYEMLDAYPMLPKKAHYLQSLQESTQTTSKPEHVQESTNIKPAMEDVDSDFDYFPSAVSSIVVSETGKKYPKKYSFYSNKISAFLNNQANKDKAAGCAEETTSSTLPPEVPTSSNTETSRSNFMVKNKFLAEFRFAELDALEANAKKGITQKQQNEISSSYDLKAGEIHSIIDVTGCNEYEDSLTESLNLIRDNPVQSRARASLPSSYLSINRIKTDLSVKKPVYGVFAKQLCLRSTRFGPVEGVMIKQELMDDEFESCSIPRLQLTVETEKGIFVKLDVSSEELSNWMRFVRPATKYDEQNLAVSQHGQSLYFTAIRTIQPKTELLVWYDPQYAEARGYKLLSESIDDFLDAEKVNDDDTYHSKTIMEPMDDCILDNDFDSADEIYLEEIESKKTEKNESRLWMCPHCNLAFSMKPLMELHVIKHTKDDNKITDELKYRNCPECKEFFLDTNELIDHVEKHGHIVERWSDASTITEMPGAEITETKEEDVHSVDEHKFSCKMCQKTFKTETALRLHKRYHVKGGTIYECRICNKSTLWSLKEFKEHVYSHAVDDVFTCPQCSKTFKRYSFIQKHMRQVHDKLSYKCTICTSQFRNMYKLNSHMTKHSDEKQFLCSQCGIRFKRYDKLTHHVKTVHNVIETFDTSEEDNNPCPNDIEDNKFYAKMQYVPQNARNQYFDCRYCCITFRRRILFLKHTLEQHPNVDLNSVPELKGLKAKIDSCSYKCNSCYLGFKKRGMLVNHFLCVHPDIDLETVPELKDPILKPQCHFYCHYCDKVYQSNSKRSAHVLKCHPGSKLPDTVKKEDIDKDPYTKQVGNLITFPYKCECCPRQFCSNPKLLCHMRKKHLESSEEKLPKKCSTNAKPSQINSTNLSGRKERVRKLEDFQNQMNAENTFYPEPRKNLPLYPKVKPCVIEVIKHIIRLKINKQRYYKSEDFLLDKSQLMNFSSTIKSTGIDQYEHVEEGGITIHSYNENHNDIEFQQILNTCAFTGS